MSEPIDNWQQNYFNYFTEIEEHFQRARGTGLFLLSPLDWALIENWKNAGIPLDAVLKGIDDAFEKWRSRKVKRRQVNSLAYCSQAVMEASTRGGASASHSERSAPFVSEELLAYLNGVMNAYRAHTAEAVQEVAASIQKLIQVLPEQITYLEELEQRLTSLEEKAVAILRSSQSDEEAFAMRAQLDQELKPYRGKMSADQISMLERRYLDTAVLERAKLPRLSLFYLR